MAEQAATMLRTGDQGAGLFAAAQAWRATAATLLAHQQSLQVTDAQLAAGWDGDAASAAISRLRPFIAWFGDAATAAHGVAGHAERLAQAHQQAVTEHPTPEYVSQLRSRYAQAMAAGDQGSASTYLTAWRDAETRSSQVVQTYAGHSVVPAAVLPPAPAPTSPQPGVGAGKLKEGKGDPSFDKEHKPDAAGDNPADDVPDAQHTQQSAPGLTPASGPKPADGSGGALKPVPPPPPVSAPVDPPSPVDAPALPDIGASMPMSFMPVLGAAGQGAGAMPASVGSAAGMPAQAISGLPMPPPMPQAPQMPQTPSGMPTTPPTGGGAPVAPASGVPPIPHIGGGGGGSHAGGGGGGSGGPAASLGAAKPATPIPSITVTPSAGSSGVSPGIGMGMMPGMMPPYSGQNGSGEKERNPDLAADEPVYVEDREHTPALVDQNEHAGG